MGQSMLSYAADVHFGLLYRYNRKTHRRGLNTLESRVLLACTEHLSLRMVKSPDTEKGN